MRIAIIGLLHVELIGLRVHLLYKSFIELPLLDLGLHFFPLFKVSSSADAER